MRIDHHAFVLCRPSAVTAVQIRHGADERESAGEKYGT
jgi:hypothetical protein